MLIGPLLRVASRLLAISSTIVLVAPIPYLSSLSIYPTITSSSLFFSFFKLGLYLRRVSFLARRSLSKVLGILKALHACFILLGIVASIALIIRYSIPLL